MKPETGGWRAKKSLDVLEATRKMPIGSEIRMILGFGTRG